MLSIFFLLIMNYKILTILLTILSVVLLATTIYYANNPQVEYSETIKRDTIVIKSIDTITIEKTNISYRDIIVLDTVFVKDTAMLFEQKRYDDSISTIYISGIEANLDSIYYRIPRDTVQILTETTNTISQKESFWHNRFTISAGLFAGYGLINKKPDVFLGVGCAVRLY